MAIVVQKYGGSSVADVQRLRCVAERVMRTRALGHDVVVVVSAMGDATDDLLAMAKQVSANPDRRELDMLLSAGERVSMSLLSMAIRELGGDAISFTGSQSGIMDPSADGTVVRRHPPRMPGAVVGVASERDVLVLEADMPPGELLPLLDECAVAGKQLHASADACHLVVSRENLHDESRLRDMLRAHFGERARLLDGLGAVSVIGAGINATYRNVRDGCAALRDLGVEANVISTSSFRITWMIPRDRLDEAVRGMHTRFIEWEQPLLP